jgi:hypothetical protein
MHFLKRIGEVVKVYKRVMELGRALGGGELWGLGIGLNQAK